MRTKWKHLGFLITLSTYVFCLQILVPPSPEYVSPICDLHTGAAIEAVAFDLQMAGSSTDKYMRTEILYQSPILVQLELVKVFTSRENETFSRREVTQLSS